MGRWLILSAVCLLFNASVILTIIGIQLRGARAAQFSPMRILLQHLYQISVLVIVDLDGIIRN